MEGAETRTGAGAAEGCFEKTSASLTVDDVYDIAKAIGAEVERLIDAHGGDCAAGLVARLVKVLELLESFASRSQESRGREEELLKAYQALQIQQQKRRAGKEEEDWDGRRETLELRQKEEQWRRRCEELQVQVQQLQEDRQELQSRLRGSQTQEDRVQRQEREVMLKLKDVVDKQRDELRAKVQQIATISKEVEALQEQLERFMKMNGELRHRQNVLQAQLKSTVERKADMEADLREKQKRIEGLQTQLDRAGVGGSSSPRQTSQGPPEKQDDKPDPDPPCFTKKEVRDILSERNELRANLFLVQEELNYYQREILNDERCPGFLLDAVRSAIRKQRTLIKAKMLGIPVDECSSDEEEKGPLFERTETDGAEKEKTAESRIRNLFGFLTRSGSGSAQMTSSTSAWEIIADSEAEGEAQPPQ